MSGMKFDIEIDDAEVKKALADLADHAGHLDPAFMEIGEMLILSTEDRFRDQVDPDGVPWVDVTPETRKHKKHPKILTESASLRGGIVWQLIPGGVEIGTNSPYGNVHQHGFEERNIPVRPYLGISEEDRDGILSILRDHLI